MAIQNGPFFSDKPLVSNKLPKLKTSTLCPVLSQSELPVVQIIMPHLETRSDFDVTEMTPLQELIQNGFLETGQKLIFNYKTEKGAERRFTGRVRPTGIEVSGRIFSVSFAAIHCIQSMGDKKAINGWNAWETEQGDYLAEIYQRAREEQPGARRSRVFKEQFYKYPRERDVVVIFGAGASYADGAPLQKDLLPALLTTTDAKLRKSSIHRSAVGFLEDNFVWNEKAGQFPTLEQVFGFIDYFIYKQESLSNNYSLARIRSVKEALIKLIHYLVVNSSGTTSRAYRLFWEYVHRHNSNLSVITMNYDTYLDEGFSHMFPRNYYLDYCLDLANYDHSDDVDHRDWWVNPREPVLALESTAPVSIKLIKIHGSLNWKYCDCCNQVLLTPYDDKLELRAGDRSQSSPNSMGSPNRCHRDGNEYQTLLVPPSYMKDLSHTIHSQLFIEASEEIRRAKKIVFVGYSLPVSDVHVKAIIKKSIDPKTEIVVVDVNKSEEFRLRYREISPNVKFMTIPFEDLVGSPRKMKSLLTVK